jgi:hypothetical protein
MRRSFRTRSMGPSGFPGLPPRAGMRCPFRAGSRSAEPRLGRRRKGSGAWLRRRSGILPLCGAFVGYRGLVARGRFHPEVTKLAKRCWGAVVPRWRGVGVLECRGAGVAGVAGVGPGSAEPRLGRRRKGSGASRRRRSGILPLCGESRKRTASNAQLPNAPTLCALGAFVRALCIVSPRHEGTKRITAAAAFGGVGGRQEAVGRRQALRITRFCAFSCLFVANLPPEAVVDAMRRSFRTRSMGPSGFPGLPPRAGMRCPFRAGSRSAEPRLGRRRKGSGA